MAVLALSISGRLEEGELLKAWGLGTASGGYQWQALTNGAWVNVGPAGTSTYTIPAGAAGTSYRLAASDAGVTTYSDPTGPAILDTKKVNAPVLAGAELSSLATENSGPSTVFEWLTFSDTDRGNYGGGSLLLQVSTSLQHGGDAHDLLSVRFSGTNAGQFSFNAATREVKYAFTSGTATTIGTMDATLSGNGNDLKIAFNANATTAVVDALINNLMASNQDDSPTADRLFTLRVTDPTGASAQRVTSQHIENSPDAPVFTSPAVFAIDENQTAVATLAATDADREAGADQGISYSLVDGAGGTDNALFGIDAGTGALRFGAAPDYEGGHSPTYSLRVRASDSNGGTVDQVVSVTVRNVSEAPVASNLQATVSEDGPSILIASGAFDQDAGDSLTYSLDASTARGTVTLEGTAFRYDPAGQFEMLKAGATFQDSFNYTVTDAAGHAVTRTVAVTVQGVNDAPVAISPFGVLEEAGAAGPGTASYSAGITVFDPDGDAVSFATTGQGTYGSVELLANGQWTYTLDNTSAAVQALRDHDMVTDTVAVDVRDAQGAVTTTQLRVVIHGADDLASISGTPDGHVLEDIGAVLTAGGVLSVTDPDAGQSQLLPQSNAFGTAGGVFNVGADGTWTYAIDNASAAVQGLTAGQSLADTLTVSSADGTAQQVLTVTIHGADDPAAFLGTTTLVVLEDNFDGNGNLSVGANVGVSDPDAGQNTVQPYSGYWGTGHLGMFSVTAQGDWTWSSQANPWEIESLAAGQTLTDTTAVMSADGTFALINVVVTGQNDAPVIAGGDTSGQVIEPGGFPPELPPPPTTATGSLWAWDKDTGDVLSWSGSGEGQYGSFAIDAASGNWTYVVDAVKSDVLVMGQSAVDSFTATVSDGHGGTTTKTIEITVYGGNETPVVDSLSTLTGTVQELPAPDGTLVLGWGSGAVYGQVVCTDDSGRILLLSDVDLFPGYSQQVLARFNADGSLDTTYGSQGRTSFQWPVTAADMQVDAQGRTVAVGYSAFNYGGTAVDFAVTRVLADGSLDASFGVGGVASIDIAGGYDYANALFFRAGGKMQLVGTASSAPGMVVVQLNEDGSLDTGFANGGKLFLPQSPYGKQLTVDGEGRFLTWSIESDPETYATEVHLERYLADGSVDTTFGVQGAAEILLPMNSASGTDLQVGPDGRIVLATTVWATTYGQTHVMLMRVNEDGTVDESFGQYGSVHTEVWGAPHTLRVDGEGRILVAGQPANTIGDPMDFMVARYLTDGTLDTSFGNGGSAITDVSHTGSNDYVTRLLLNGDGTVLLAGATMDSTYSTDPALAKYTADGQLDTTFGVGVDPMVSGMILATDPDAWPGGYQPLKYAATNAGVYGTFNLLSPEYGYWTYTLDNTRAATQALDQGEAVNDTITVAIRDGFGGVTYQDVVITVIGSYDPPANPG